MASEATIQSGLNIRKTSGSLTQIDYRSPATTFRVDVSGTKGPTPGALTIPTGGKTISLQELTTPGLVCIHNLDATNYIVVGIWDVGLNVFYPLIEVGPGESYTLKLWRSIQEEYIGTGTGTSGPGNQLFAKAIGGDCVVSFDAFER